MRVLLTIIVGIVIGLWWRVKNRDPNVDPRVLRDRPPATSRGEIAAPILSIYAGSAVDAYAVSMVERRYNEWSADPSPARLALAREAFLTAAVDQLQRSGVTAEALADLQASGTTSREETFAPVSDRIASLADRSQIYPTVSVTTRVRGAVVAYQTSGDRIHGVKPMTLASKTDCTVKELPLGEYYMWAMRGGVDTSSRERLIPIAGKQVSVELEENK